jgi:hypothetical protein
LAGKRQHAHRLAVHCEDRVGQIHYGSRILSRRLAEAGIRHRYEEFDDDHSDIDYRMDVSLPFLYKALT